MTTYTECRQRLRAILAGPVCLSPATVFDALSARVAESVGFQVGVLSGSVCASTVIAAPDIVPRAASPGGLSTAIRSIIRANLAVFAGAAGRRAL